MSAHAQFRGKRTRLREIEDGWGGGLAPAGECPPKESCTGTLNYYYCATGRVERDCTETRWYVEWRWDEFGRLYCYVAPLVVDRWTVKMSCDSVTVVVGPGCGDQI